MTATALHTEDVGSGVRILFFDGSTAIEHECDGGDTAAVLLPEGHPVVMVPARVALWACPSCHLSGAVVDGGWVPA